ncbi:palmitoyl-(protein) hydrolase [Aureococcus anophagefferens]|nr:palmitoyl-(protein) hydrolase [Aureococcus anophagefferens]
MDKSVDFFAAKIRADPKLAGGFNAFGFSQGNNVIRGYIIKYNDPPVLGDLAYNKLVQDILFQANYYRDPANVRRVLPQELALAHWNGEGEVNATYVANWAKTDNFIWVEGTLDTVVWPRQGEQWGAMDPIPVEDRAADERDDWYTKDTFGLKTADEAGKNHFESFVGEHPHDRRPPMGWLCATSPE